MYANDGRMLVLNLSSGRPKLDSLESITDEQRVQLLRTMAAYRGTYPSKPAVIVVKRGRRPGLLDAAAEVSHRREPAMAGQQTRLERADQANPSTTPPARKSAIVTARKPAKAIPDGWLPDTPEEHKRRGDAADALFQEMKRRISGKGEG